MAKIQNPTQTHDPYLVTVKRAIKEEKILKRKEKVHQDQNNKTKSFLSQKVHISNYIHLSESLQMFLGTGLFVFLPYVVGIVLIFLLIAQANIFIYHNLEMNSFLFAWIIGYESIAIILLSIIIKSAISFKKDT